MKIDEPKTPFDTSKSEDEDFCEGEQQEQEATSLDANLLAAKIAAEGHKGPRPRKISMTSDSCEEEEQDMTPEVREKKKKFEQKRKIHYDEFQAVKMARQLMEEDEKEEEQSSSPMDFANGV